MKKVSVHRTRIGKDIVAEFAIPPRLRDQKKGRVIIMARGMPSASSPRPYLEFFAREGFYAICPQYRGAWESNGSFLAEEPTEDIRYVVEHLDQPLRDAWDGVHYLLPSNPAVYLFGGSFGGPAALLLSKHPLVKKVVGLCPVVDFRAKSIDEPMDKFLAYTKEGFGMAYRFTQRDWNKLARTKFYNPVQQLERIDSSKILLIHNEDDRSVPFSSVKKFAQKTDSRLISQKKGGHGGFKQAMKPYYWSRIRRFLEE